MAFEEMSGPRLSNAPKQVFASFDEKSSPAGITTHRPSVSLLKDTPPSIIVALSQLSPIVSTLNTILSLVTWTGEDNWSSFLMLSIFWIACLYGDVVFHYAGNWLLLLLLGIGYFRKKTETRSIVQAIEKGADPITTGIPDTQKIMDATLYEIDCLRARCNLLSSTFLPLYSIFTWEDPERSALIGMRLAFVTPLYVAALWLLTTRALLLIIGTCFLTFTSPWFKVICTVCWRLRVVRRTASLLLGVEYLPGESNIMQAFSRPAPMAAFGTKADIATGSRSGDYKFTTTISVSENQRRWLGLGWTPSLLPHERAPYTDADDRPGVAPENTALPDPKTTVSDGITRTVAWKWIDTEWRVEKDRDRDFDGWLYFDNTWRHPTAKEEFGRYTRRRKWIRNAECTETVVDASRNSPTSANVGVTSIIASTPTQDESRARKNSRTIDPEKVKFSGFLSSSHGNGEAAAASRMNDKSEIIREENTPRREWREVDGGGKELVNVDSGVKKRPFALRRKSSRMSTTSLGVD